METSKTSAPINFFRQFFMAVSFIFLTVAGFAQDATKSVDVNISSGSGGFFSNTWVWVIGIAVFILLLVALLRGGGRRSA